MFTTRVQCGFRGLLIGRSALAVGVLTLSSCTSFSGANPSITTAIFAPSPTASDLPTPTDTGTATMTDTFAATPATATLFSAQLKGSSGVTHYAYYPDSFFVEAWWGDILNRATGDGLITPNSTTQAIQVSVAGSTYSRSRPQIQFRKYATNQLVFTAPQNTTNTTLLTSFVPPTTDTLRFSIIDTGDEARFNTYTVLITQ